MIFNDTYYLLYKKLRSIIYGTLQNVRSYNLIQQRFANILPLFVAKYIYFNLQCDRLLAQHLPENLVTFISNTLYACKYS
jgi:hypothetical protein